MHGSLSLRQRFMPGISMLAMVAAAPGMAQTANQWTGDVDNDFSKSGNWTDGAPSDNVVVDFRPRSPAVSNQVQVNRGEFRSDVTVEATGQLGATSILNTAGVLTNNGQILTTSGLDNRANLENAAGAVIGGGVRNSLSLNNYGTINGGIVNTVIGTARLKAGGLVNGGIDNVGTVLMSSSVNGDIVNQSRGGVYIFGSGLTLNGNLTNRDNALTVLYSRLTGIGTVTNSATGRADGDFKIDTFGNLDAERIINSEGSVLSNAGITSARSAIENAGTLLNLVSGTLNGGVVNAGTLTNAGIVNGGVTNSGTLTNAATGTISGGIINSGSVANLGTVNDPVTQSAGLFDNQGRLRGGVTLTGGTLTSSAATSIIEGGLTNAGAATIAGTLTGPIVNQSGGRIDFVGDTHGDGVVDNQAGATMTLSGGNVDGLNTMTNAGTIAVSGQRILATAGLTNTATGTIAMANGVAGDSLTVSGPYTGQSGSRITVDVDTTAGAPVADRLTVNGTATGTSNVVLNFTRPAGKLASPLEVVSVGAGSSLKLNTGVVANNQYLNYTLAESASGSGIYQLSSQVDVAPLTSITSRLSTGLASFHAALHQPIQPLISRPRNCRSNQMTIAPFVRAMAGEDRWTDSATAGSGSEASIKGTNRLTGLQGGIDVGLCNAGGTGWNVSLGVTGGQVSIGGSTTAIGTASGASTITTGTMNLPFFGAYLLLNRNGFNLELGVRHDSLEAGLSTTGPGGSYLASSDKIKGKGWSFNGLMSYKFVMANSFYFEPHVGISTGTMSLGTAQLATGGGDTLALGRLNAGMIRAGVNLGMSMRSSGGLVVSPFAHFSVWSSLGGNASALATLGSIGETVAVRSASGGQFVQAGLGIMARNASGSLSGFVRGDMRFGDAVQGHTIQAGVRLAF